MPISFRHAILGFLAGLAATPLGAQVFAIESPSAVAGSPVSECFATDIDGDGRLDLVGWDDTNVPANYRPLFVWLNQGEGSFALVGVPSLTVMDRHSVAAGDMDGDGDIDFVATGSTFPQTSIVSVLRNFGAAVVPLHYALSDYREDVEIADLDGDGDLDVVADGGDILLNDGAGSLGAPTALWLHEFDGTVYHSRFDLCDVDADGDKDIVLVRETAPTLAMPPGTVAYVMNLETWINDGSAGFSRLAIASWPALATIVDLDVADVDADGDLDIVTTERSAQTAGVGTVRVFKRGATGVAAAEVLENLPIGSLRNPVHVVDLDGDRDADLVLSADGDVRIQRARPTNFESVASVVLARPVAGIQTLVADVLGDGAPDIVVFNDWFDTTTVPPPAVSVVSAHENTSRSADKRFVTVLGGSAQGANAGTSFLAPLRVLVTDSMGAPREGENVFFEPIAGDVLLPSGPVVTDDEGIAEASATAGPLGGSILVHASRAAEFAAFSLFGRRFDATYAGGVLTTTLATELSDQPLLVAYDTDGVPTLPTAFGEIVTGVFTGSSVTTIVRDGVGFTNFIDPTVITDPAGIWTRIDSVPPQFVGVGVPIVIQCYAFVGSGSHLVSTPIRLAL